MSNSYLPEDVLLYDPAWIDTKLPTGFWLMDSPEDVLAVQVNAGLLRDSFPQEAARACEMFLMQFPYVLLVAADRERRAAMERTARALFPGVVLLRVEDKGFRGCSSVRELRDSFGVKAVDRLLLEAVELPCSGLLDLADVNQPDFSNLDKVLSGIPNLDRALGGFYLGELSIWTGKRGEGKSTILNQMLLESIDQGYPVCAYSGELPAWKFKYWASLQAAGPDNIRVQKDAQSGRYVPRPTPFAQQLIDDWWRGRYLLYDIGTNTYHDTASILRIFQYAYRRYGARVFLVDNLMTARFKTSDRDFYRAQSEFVAQLAGFAHNNQVHVHLVAHPRKTDRIDDADAVSGIGDVTNLADNVFTMENDDDKASTQDSILTILKNRFWGERGRSIGLCFDKRSKRFYKSGTGNPNKAFGWALAAPQGTIRLPEDDMEQDPFETDRKDAGI